MLAVGPSVRAGTPWRPSSFPSRWRTAGSGLFAETGSAARSPCLNFWGSTLSWARVTRGPGIARETCSIGTSRTRRPLALSIIRGSGPRFTTTLFSTTMLFTTRVLLMITVVLDCGMMQVRTRGAKKLPADTKTKGETVEAPKLAETPT